MFELIRAKIDEYGKKYQLDLVYIIKNEFWVYFRLAISLLCGFAISITFARMAPKEIFGQYNFILAILAMVSLVSLPGFVNAIIRSVARGRDGNYREAVKIRFLWSLLGIPALLGAGAYYYYYDIQIIGICLMIASIFPPFIWAPNIWESLLIGKRRFDLTARYGSIHSIASAASMVGVLLLSADHLVPIVVVYLTINSLLSCIFYWRSLRYIENNQKDSECRGYGYFLTTANIISTLADNIDKILLGILMGAAPLAVYSIAKTIPDGIRTVLKPVWSPFMPKFTQDEIEMREVHAKTKAFILPLIIVTFIGAVLYWFFIDDAVLFFFSTKYADSIPYVKMLLLMILASIPGTLWGTFAIAKRRRKTIFLRSHVFSLVRLLIVSGFVYKWGIMGAVWALNLNMVLHALLTWAGLRWEKVSPQR